MIEIKITPNFPIISYKALERNSQGYIIKMLQLQLY